MLRKLISAIAIASVAAADEAKEEDAPIHTHLDNIEELENFKWDHVIFKTKKDCALDNYPAVSLFLDHPNILAS